MLVSALAERVWVILAERIQHCESLRELSSVGCLHSNVDCYSGFLDGGDRHDMDEAQIPNDAGPVGDRIDVHDTNAKTLEVVDRGREVRRGHDVRYIVHDAAAGLGSKDD